MKKTIFTMILMLASSSQASNAFKSIQCSFTTPFIITTYSAAQSTLTYVGDIHGNTEKVTVVHNVSQKNISDSTFDLVSADGQTIQMLVLSHKGSNGMSDPIYPYEVTDKSINSIGGCQEIISKPNE